MKKNEIDIEKIISILWFERHVCYNSNKTHQKLEKARKSLLETLDENQIELFYIFENANALFEIETEDQLISFVLAFFHAINK